MVLSVFANSSHAVKAFSVLVFPFAFLSFVRAITFQSISISCHDIYRLDLFMINLFLGFCDFIFLFTLAFLLRYFFAFSFNLFVK